MAKAEDATTTVSDPQTSDAATEPTNTSAVTPTTAPDLEAGINHLRGIDSGALRIWTVKGPKEVGGTISAVFMQDTSRVIMLHQLNSGKFATFERVEL